MGHHIRRSAAVVVLEGACHGGLCLWLWAEGQSPSFVGWPIPPQRYYLIQGLALPVLMPALWLVASRVTARLAGVTARQVAAPLGLALAIPTLLLLVIPDAIAYHLGGMDGLSAAARLLGPMAGAGLLLSSAWAVVRACPQIPTVRAVLASVGGLLAALVLGGLVIR